MHQGHMDKERSVQLEVDELFRSWMFNVSIVGALLFSLLGFLDYFSTPENFRTFLTYRIVMSLLLILAAIPLKFSKNRQLVYGISTVAVAASAATIEMMILRFGGHASPYYAGQILLVVCIAGILPASTRFVSIVTALIYAIYLLPILLYDPITEVRLFFTHNYFLIAVSASALVLRHMGYKSMIDRLSLQYDLRQHQLHLEEEVAERTIEHTMAISALREEIVQRRYMEAALKKASDEWRSTFDSTRDAIFMLDKEFTVIKANAAAARMLGLPTAEAFGKSICGLFQCTAEEEAQSPLPEMQETRQRSEKEIYRADLGIWIRVTADPIVDSMGRLSGAVLTIRDTTEVKTLQNSILQAKMDWEDSFDTINDAITVQDNDYNITRANKAAGVLLGITASDWQQAKCYRFFHGTACPPARCVSCETVRTGLPVTVEVFEPHLNKHLEVKALPRFDKNRKLIGLIHVVRDITDRKHAEEEHQKLQTQFLQSQKMDSIGRFAGGIAHDLNNILSVVIGYSELSLSLQPGDERQREYVENIESAGEKAAALTRQILAFSRKQVLEMKPLNLTAIIEQLGKMVNRLIGEDIVVVYKLGVLQQNIMADASQLEQVILNLVVNARDAMPHGGSLTIATEEIAQQEAQEQDNRTPPPGHYIMLSVRDTGTGIPPEIQERIFEPFFTTKERGKGTGLGLATVYGIVKQHSGYIYVESEPGIGTIFRTYFPTTTAEESRQDQQGRHEGIPLGKETIILVDDDASIRTLACNILRPLGYRVHEAAGAGEAMNISRNLQGTVDLLVTDVVMPEKNGRELAEMLRQERASIKVLFMSGYTDDIIARHGILETGAAFLQKPLNRTRLAKKVRQVLDSEHAGTVPTPLLPAGRKLSVLIADDDRTSYELVKLYVSIMTDKVAWAANGQVAVDLFRTNAYDLVIMDMVMPIMDGCAAITAIRAWEVQCNRKATPIIVLTGNSPGEDQQACSSTEVSAFLGKPLHRETLLHAIDACFESMQMPVSAETVQDSSARIRVKGDESLKDLIPDYLKDKQADVAAIQEALPLRNFDRIRILGHSMKGSGASYGFDEISALGRDIEKAAKSENPELLITLINQLDQYLQRAEVVYE